VRRYVEDPGIGYQKVERILDAAHAISMQCDRNFLFNDGGARYPERKNVVNHMDKEDDWQHLSYKGSKTEQEDKPPGQQDLLLFIINNQPYLKDWEKDLLGIVRDEMHYFLPQIETKIMNEGWASFWHYTILSRLGLPSSIHMDFIRSHNQVIRPHVGGLNPYHIGYAIFNKLAGSDGHQINYEINPEIFNVRKIDRDTSFLRRFLTRELAEELFLFEYKTENGKTLVNETSDSKEGWEKIRETLISSVGINSIPVIEVKEITSRNELILSHKYDNRDLQLSYLEKTMEHVFTLWNNPVFLTTIVDGEEETFKCKNGKVGS
jgi:stage V sporulation protein R